MAAATATSLQDERRRQRTPAAARDFLRSTTGWRVVSPDHGDRGGMVAHRGVLHPDEYVDLAILVPSVERLLGFTLDELRFVYRQGPKSEAQRLLRARIDARLLRIANGGGNLEALAYATEVERATIGRALRRARRAADESTRLRRQHRRQSRQTRRAMLASRDGAVCHYCGRRQKLRRMTIDHVVPLSLGGDNDLTNLVLACAPCNQAKGDNVWKGAAPTPGGCAQPAKRPSWIEGSRGIQRR